MDNIEQRSEETARARADAGAQQAAEQPMRPRKNKRGGAGKWILGIVLLIAAILIVLGLLNRFGAITLPGASGVSGNGGNVVATVNGEEITQQQFTDRIAQTEVSLRAQGATDQQIQNAEQNIRTQALRDLISETLVLQEAEEAQLTASNQEVQQQLEQTKSQFENEQAFQQQLQSNNLTESEFADVIRRQLTIRNYLQNEIATDTVSVSAAEIQQTYAQLSSQQENVPPLSQVRSQLRNQLRQQKTNQLVSEFVTRLQGESTIEILTDEVDLQLGGSDTNAATQSGVAN